MDLIVTMDDATSEIYSMLLVEEEGTASTFQALGEVIGERGLFCALYTDRGSHYSTPEGWREGLEDATNASGTGFIGISDRTYRSLFAAARGRSERMFGTLQGRLPKDLRLAGNQDGRGRQRVVEGALYRRA